MSMNECLLKIPTCKMAAILNKRFKKKNKKKKIMELCTYQSDQ